MLVPAAAGEGINAVCLGLIKALQDKGAKVGFFNPVESASGTNAAAVVKETYGIASPEPVNRVHASRLIAEGDETVLLEEILGEFEEYKAAGSYDVIVAKGTSGCCGSPWADELNYGIANAIDAEVVLVSGTKGGKDNFYDRLDTLKKKFSSRLQGLIVSFMPLVLGLALFALKPDVMKPFLFSFQGAVCIGLTLVFVTLGWLLIRRIIRIDV